MNRLKAFLLIVICGINVIGVSASAYLSEKNHEAIISVVQPDQFSQASHSEVFQSLDVLSSYDHADHEGKEGKDCSNEDNGCPQCHQGHCGFLVASALAIVDPNLIGAIQSVFSIPYLSVDLSGPRKPPRA